MLIESNKTRSKYNLSYRSPSDQKKLQKTEKRTVEIGKDIEQYFAEKKVNYITMTVAELENTTRDRSLSDSGNKSNYTFHLVRFLEKTIPGFDGNLFRCLRDEHIRSSFSKRRPRPNRRGARNN